MKVSNFRRQNPGDFPTMNDDGKRLLDQLNDVFEGVVTCLQGNIAAADNMNSETKTLKMQHNVSTDIGITRIRGKVQEVHLLWSSLYDYAKLAWQRVTDATVRVKLMWDSAPTSEVEVTLRFLGP